MIKLTLDALKNLNLKDFQKKATAQQKIHLSWAISFAKKQSLNSSMDFEDFNLHLKKTMDWSEADNEDLNTSRQEIVRLFEESKLM